MTESIIFSPEKTPKSKVPKEEIERLLFGLSDPDKSFVDVPADNYHNEAGISSTEIRQASVSMYNFFSYKVLGNKKKETPAMKFGTLAHSALLEPKKFLANNRVAPLTCTNDKEGEHKLNKRKSCCSATYTKWLNDLPRDAEVLDQKDADLLLSMIDRMWSHPKVHKVFDTGVAEKSCWWRDEKTGLLCKARFDWMIEDDNILVDLKTAESADPKEFSRHIYNFGYHYQAAWYARGYRAITGRPMKSFLFVVSEKKPPYDCAVYVADQEMLDIADIHIEHLLTRIKDSYDSNTWEGYSNEIESIGLPAWAYKE